MDNFLKVGSEVLKARPGFKLVGRAEDLRRFSSILMRSKASSVLLVGAGGVGLTSLCLGLQASKEDDDAPFDIVSKRIHWLDTDGLFSSGDVDKMNKSFQTILAILKRTSDSILIIEDTRDFIEGARNNGVSHFINSLNAAVKNGDTQVVLEAKDDDLDFILKAHSDMRECYTMIDLSEPVGEALLEISKNSAKILEQHHGIKIAEDAITTSIELTNKYRTRDMSLSRAQPERSVNLIDRALASYRLSAHSRHPDALALEKTSNFDKEEVARLDSEYAVTQGQMKKLFKASRAAELAIIDLESQIDKQKEIEEERRKKGEEIEEEAHKSSLSAFARLASNAGNDSEIVKGLKDQLKAFEVAAKANHEQFDKLAAAINDKLLLTKDLVLMEFSRISGIPVNKLNEDEKVRLMTLEAVMKNRIYGQDDALKRVVNAIKIAKVGKRNGNKPQAAFLFLGPTGTGKTETSKALAAAMLDDESALTRFDMSEYMEKHAVAKLIGAPPGYEGFEAGGLLTNLARKNPVRVYLFDEIEKADPAVFDIFLQILSDGRLTDNVGRTVSFSDAIIIMTTNLGQTALLNQMLTNEEAKRDAMEEIGHRYRPEFLNRFAGKENIICFNRLELDSIEKIVTREIVDINKAYADNGIFVSISPEELRSFCKDQYDPSSGARGLPGFIQANLEPVIADIVLENNDLTGRLNVTYDGVHKRFVTTFKENIESSIRTLNELAHT